MVEDVTDLETLLKRVDETLSVVQQRQEEILVHSGNVEGYLLFGVVVVLCLFVYKFFRMFF